MDFDLSKLRVALAHHWLVSMRGGEKVLEQICALFPHSTIHTLVANPPKLSALLRSHRIQTSCLQKFPGGVRHYKKMLPFFPEIISRMTVDASVDLVMSSDASVIKGLNYPEGIPHFCYCHSPPRYLWDLQDDYMESAESGGAMGRAVFKRVMPYIREFDRRAAQRVTHFIANSNFVRERIQTCYEREATVIYPPVNLEHFAVAQTPPEDFYLVISQLVPYKRIHIAIEAFNRMKRRLVIIGEGSESARLHRLAGSSISFLGSQPLAALKDHYRRCRALIFPGVEDFGITPLEAQASGRPTIAFRSGGALETILEGSTGLFFDENNPDSLVDAVLRFERQAKDFDPEICRENAERFSAGRFREKLVAFIGNSLHHGRRLVPR